MSTSTIDTQMTIHEKIDFFIRMILTYRNVSIEVLTANKESNLSKFIYILHFTKCFFVFWRIKKHFIILFLDNFFRKNGLHFRKNTDKDSFIDLYSIGQKIHENVVCKEEDAPCDCLTYLEQLNLLNENMDDRHSFTDEEKISFFNLSKENPKCFLLIDQIIKNYGAEIYQLDKLVLINVIFLK